MAEAARWPTQERVRAARCGTKDRLGTGIEGQGQARTSCGETGVGVGQGQCPANVCVRVPAWWRRACECACAVRVRACICGRACGICVSVGVDGELVARGASDEACVQTWACLVIQLGAARHTANTCSARSLSV